MTPSKPIDLRAPIPVLTGPTASGKSARALELAEREGFEIVSMDSMAVYRRMDLGTAKPSHEELARVPHHLVDVVEPSEDFDTARFCALADALVRDAVQSDKRLLFVGGTPLYLMAFFKGMLEGQPADEALRAELEKQEEDEPGSLRRELCRVDPEAALRIHPNDLRRTVRALEVFRRSGRTISEQQDTFGQDGFRVPCRIAILDWPAEELKDRIKRRTQTMLDQGLLEETRSIRDSIGFGRTASLAIGYAECLRHLEKPFKDEEELRNRIRRATHGLVKRQRNWFRRLPEAHRLRPEDDADTVRRALLTSG
ncbi:MAG: tRNA (adenosine(37)-N6)-dimethylallyltransferase MiaA [Planctomycetota bacterium]